MNKKKFNLAEHSLFKKPLSINDKNDIIKDRIERFGEKIIVDIPLDQIEIHLGTKLTIMPSTTLKGRQFEVRRLRGEDLDPSGNINVDQIKNDQKKDPKRIRKGSENDPKIIKKEYKKDPKRIQKGSEKDPKTIRTYSGNYPKMIRK